MTLESKPVGPTPKERREANINEREAQGRRLATDCGPVVDTYRHGEYLNLFISAEDRQDTEKISVWMSVDSAVMVAELILKHARSAPARLDHER